MSTIVLAALAVLLSQPAPAPVSAPAPVVPAATQEGERKICRTPPPTGTRIKQRKVCATQRQWDEQRDETLQTTEGWNKDASGKLLNVPRGPVVPR